MNSGFIKINFLGIMHKEKVRNFLLLPTEPMFKQNFYINPSFKHKDEINLYHSITLKLVFITSSHEICF